MHDELFSGFSEAGWDEQLGTPSRRSLPTSCRSCLTRRYRPPRPPIAWAASNPTCFGCVEPPEPKLLACNAIRQFHAYLLLSMRGPSLTDETRVQPVTNGLSTRGSGAFPYPRLLLRHSVIGFLELSILVDERPCAGATLRRGWSSHVGGAPRPLRGACSRPRSPFQRDLPRTVNFDGLAEAAALRP